MPQMDSPDFYRDMLVRSLDLLGILRRELQAERSLASASDADSDDLDPRAVTSIEEVEFIAGALRRTLQDKKVRLTIGLRRLWSCEEWT